MAKIFSLDEVLSSIVFGKLPLHKQVDIEFGYENYSQSEKQDLTKNLLLFEEFYEKLNSINTKEDRDSFQREFLDKYRLGKFLEVAAQKKEKLNKMEEKFKFEDEEALKQLISTL